MAASQPPVAYRIETACAGSALLEPGPTRRWSKRRLISASIICARGCRGARTNPSRWRRRWHSCAPSAASSIWTGTMSMASSIGKNDWSWAGVGCIRAHGVGCGDWLLRCRPLHRPGAGNRSHSRANPAVAFEVSGVLRVEFTATLAMSAAPRSRRKLGDFHQVTRRRKDRLPDGNFRDTMIWTLRTSIRSARQAMPSSRRLMCWGNACFRVWVAQFHRGTICHSDARRKKE